MSEGGQMRGVKGTRVGMLRGKGRDSMTRKRVGVVEVPTRRQTEEGADSRTQREQPKTSWEYGMDSDDLNWICHR